MVLILFIPALNKKYPFFILGFGILYLFLALRYDFGNDYMSYFYMHESLNSGRGGLINEEPLYKYFNILIPNFYVLIAMISLFYVLVIQKLIAKNLTKKLYWFATLILLINPYLFLIHLSSLRQTLAICFVIIAVYFRDKNTFPLYFIFIIVAAGFHQSAIIMLPVFFLLNDKKLNLVKISSICIGLTLLIFTPLFDWGIVAILEYFPEGYSYYYEQGLNNSIRATLISSFFFFLILFNINKLEGKEIIYGKLSLFSTAISLLAYKVSIITRIGMYFDIFLIIAIPLIFSKITNSKVKIILFLVMITIYILRYWSFFNTEIWIDGYRSYQTILTK